jgi:hypothetical protein
LATINIIQRKTIAGTQYPLQRITFQKPDLKGAMHEQVNEVYFRPDAVAVLLIDPAAKQFLLARQFRLPTFLNGSEKGYLVETCAGLIDEGETPEQAARREVEEEPAIRLTKSKRSVVSILQRAELRNSFICLQLTTIARGRTEKAVEKMVKAKTSNYWKLALMMRVSN